MELQGPSTLKALCTLLFGPFYRVFVTKNDYQKINLPYREPFLVRGNRWQLHCEYDQEHLYFVR